MSVPLRDFLDDAQIHDSDVLLRAVSPKNIEDFQSLSKTREIPSRAWQDQKEDEAAKWGLRPCASVAVERLLSDNNRDVEYWLKNFFRPEYGVIRIEAGAVRCAASVEGTQLPQGVMLHATSDQPWHAVIWSKRGASKRNKTEMRAMVLSSTWVKLPQ